MNKKTTYELTITEKLQQLPLPGLEDAIWTRVKAQLDLDLPTDDGDDNTPDAPSGGGWQWGAGMIVFVAALVTIFLLFKNPSEKQQALPVQTLPNNTSLPATSVGETGPLQKPPNFNTGTVPTSSPVTSQPLNLPLPADSGAPVPTVSLPVADTLQQTTMVLPPPTVLQDSAAPKKRPRGVSGITDSDYRIVPSRKDSL